MKVRNRILLLSSLLLLVSVAGIGNLIWQMQRIEQMQEPKYILQVMLLLGLFGAGLIFAIIELVRQEIRNPVFHLAAQVARLKERQINGQRLELIGSKDIDLLNRALNDLLDSFEMRDNYARLFIQMSPDIIYLLDQDDYILFCNMNAARQWNCQPAEIIGKRQEELFPPDIVKRHKQIIKKIFETGQPVATDVYEMIGERHRWIDARMMPVLDQDGQVTAVIDISRDITERKQAEAELRESENRYHGVFAGTPDGIIVHDAEGQILDANAAMAQRLEIQRETLLGRQLAGFVTPDNAAKISKNAQIALAGQAQIFETTYVSASGKTIPAEVHERRIQWRDGQAAVLSISRDITERKQAEEGLRKANADLQAALQELRKAQRQMVHEARLNALGQMASGIAHDFNNVLMPIHGYSDLLLACPETLSDQKNTIEILQIINKAAQDGGSIVQRLRDFYRPDEQIEFTSLNIKTLIEEAVVLTQPRWNQEMMAKGVTVNIRVNIGTVPVIMGNASQLQDVFINLILNAVDAMPTGGTLTFDAEQEGEAIVIRVADSGLGMSEETRARCFEPFYSTKGPLGTGLGLSVVYGIIQRHLGTIEVKSQQFSGTTFVIQLPTRPPKSEVKKIETTERRAIRGLRVLVADDEEPARNIISRFLKSDGHLVDCAGNGQEALNKFLAGKFDVVITDQAMPGGMTGEDLAFMIKANSPGTPVILVTGFASSATGGEVDISKVDLVLKKPLALRDLQKALWKVRPQNELSNAKKPGGDNGRGKT